MASVLWGEQTADTVAEAARENALVIVPLGCTEQHAAHLPVDTDTYQVERLTVEGARKAADEHGVRVLVLPTLPFGPAAEHAGYAGTISLLNETYAHIIKQIIWSVIDSGFSRVAVMSGCGGHYVVPGALYEVKAEARRIGRAVTLRLIPADEDFQTVHERHFSGTDGGHAATLETSQCLANRAHLVRREALRAPSLVRFEERAHGGEIFLFSEVSNTGALGDPTPATVEGGKAVWEELITLFARRLAVFDEQDRAPSQR